MKSGTKRWQDKLIYCFGTSITWYDGQPYSAAHAESGNIAKGYLSYMRDELGANVVNYGVSGGTIQNHIAAEIKSKSYTNVDVITIEGAINDWATTSSPPPIGTIEPIGSSFYLSTTTGALQSAVEHVISSNPETRIYFITGIRGYFKPESSNPFAGCEYPPTYQQMFMNVGKLYGIVVIDAYGQCGFNMANYSYYYKDMGTMGDRYVHIGDEGYKRMAEVIVSNL